MFKKRIVCLGLILTLSSCIIGCSSESNTTTESITTESSRTEETATDGATTEEVTTEEATTKPEVPKKEESLVWDGTTVYINDENGMTLFKEADEEKRNSVVTAILKDGIRYIESGLFYNCNSLTDVTIPESVILIQAEAFGLCSSIEKIKLPESLLSMEPGVFVMCEKLKSITIPSKINYIPMACFTNCTSLDTVIFSQNTSGIGIEANAFSYCPIYNIILPTDYVSINSSAFSGCPSNINIYTFESCNNKIEVYNYESSRDFGNSVSKAIIHNFKVDICTELGHIWGDAPGCRMEYPCILCGELSDDIAPHNYDKDMVCTECGYGSDEYDEDTPDSSNADN